MLTQSVSRPRRRWMWWLAGIFGGATLVLAAGVASMVMLDGDAAALRNRIAQAGGWTLKRQVQVTVGEGTLDATRLALGWCGKVDEDARTALAAVRAASVGVYDVGRDAGELPAAGWTAVDEFMTRRGWTRTIGVKDAHDTVMIYMRAADRDAKTLRVCLAVRSEEDLVVVSAELVADAVEKLVQGKLGAEFAGRCARTRESPVAMLSALVK